MRIPLILGSLLLVSACGSARVSGEVGQACMSGGREAANATLCSCVQRAADQSLSAADQRRAASFFSDPQAAQDTRQSDRSGDEAFWDRYMAFVDRARARCG
jgi:hypothetical protein